MTQIQRQEGMGGVKKLTGAQRLYLHFMHRRQAPIGEHLIRPQHIAMLRRLEDRGLVARNRNCCWYITRAGQDALRIRPTPTGGSNEAE